MKNITVTLDEKTAAWARLAAARSNMSLSRFLGELLNARMRESREYDRAMRAWMARPLRPLSAPGDVYPKRDELYDRPGPR